jgi:hypothetical protein
MRVSAVFARMVKRVYGVFYSSLKAFGWSISIPDISQSNSLQVRFLTSDSFLGHW